MSILNIFIPRYEDFSRQVNFLGFKVDGGGFLTLKSNRRDRGDSEANDDSSANAIDCVLCLRKEANNNNDLIPNPTQTSSQAHSGRGEAIPAKSIM